MWEEQHFLGADEDAEIESTGITTNTAFSPSWFDGEGRFVSLPLGRLVGRSTAVKRRTLPSLGTASKRAFVLASRSVTWQRNVGSARPPTIDVYRLTDEELEVLESALRKSIFGSPP